MLPAYLLATAAFSGPCHVLLLFLVVSFLFTGVLSFSSSLQSCSSHRMRILLSSLWLSTYKPLMQTEDTRASSPCDRGSL